MSHLINLAKLRRLQNNRKEFTKNFAVIEFVFQGLYAPETVGKGLDAFLTYAYYSDNQDKLYNNSVKGVPQPNYTIVNNEGGFTLTVKNPTTSHMDKINFKNEPIARKLFGLQQGQRIKLQLAVVYELVAQELSSYYEPQYRLEILGYTK